MLRKKYFLLSCLAILVIAIGSVFAQVSDRAVQILGDIWSTAGIKEKPANLKKVVDPTKYAPRDVADDVAYSQIFRHIEQLNKKADEDEQKGRDARGLRNIYKDTAQLDEQQSQILNNVAAKANRAVADLDARAQQIINEIHAQTPDHKLPKGQAPPRPPQELSDLAGRRRELIMQAVAEIRANFGEEAFARFSQFVNQKIKPGIKPANGRKANPNGE